MCVLIVLLDISMGSSCCKEGEEGEWDEVAEEEASSWWPEEIFPKNVDNQLKKFNDKL